MSHLPITEYNSTLILIIKCEGDCHDILQELQYLSDPVVIISNTLFVTGFAKIDHVTRTEICYKYSDNVDEETRSAFMPTQVYNRACGDNGGALFRLDGHQLLPVPTGLVPASCVMLTVKNSPHHLFPTLHIAILLRDS